MRTILRTVMLACMITVNPVLSGPVPTATDVHTVTIEADDVTLHAHLYPVDGIDPSQVIVLLHGWAWSDDDPRQALAPYARAFRQQGYSVLVPSMRGWPPTGGVDDCAGKQVADVLRMLEWLDREHGVSADQRFLVGYSQGGQVALLAAGRGAPVRAVAAFAPVVDPGAWGEQTNIDGIRDYVMEECGGPGGWQTRNVLNRVDGLHKPLLLVHGDADQRVPTRQSVELYSRLQALQRPVKLRLIPGTGHDQADVLEPRLAIEFFRSIGNLAD